MEYNSSREFFDNYLAHVFARPPSTNWCLEWEEHLEAKVVIHALWVNWENSYQQYALEGLAVWIRDYAYPMLERLMADKGTFDGCDWDEKRHQPSCRPLTG
jgi:hypothetical protein